MDWIARLTTLTVVGLALGCTRPNAGFDTDDAAGTDTETSGKDSTSSDPPATTVDPDGGTTEAPPGDSTTGEGSTSSEPTTTGEETGNPVDGRIVLFQGPHMWGDAIGKVGLPTAEFIDGECEAVHARSYPEVECPTGQVWGLLSAPDNPFAGYPGRPGGEGLMDAAVFAPDEATLVALDFASLVAGDLEVPLVGTIVDGPGDAVYWWGDGEGGGAQGPACEGWTAFKGEGAIIIVDEVSPLYYYGTQTCSQGFPILCICF